METEDFDFVAAEHDRLVKAITKLDKTQHITEPTRNEPTNINSEFNLIKRSKKLKLDNIVKVLEDTAHNVKIRKKLKVSQDSAKVLPKPLEKPQAERIKRATGYEVTKKKVGRWDPVVARNRTVDFVSFPLKSATETKLKPTNVFLSKLKLKSPLEMELDEVDPVPEIEPVVEEQQHYPMSYEEMVEHRQHLAKFRAQQSYKAAKAKRQSKIKSKKYHRILKKEKLKQQLKEFEELQTTNPEEALRKLEELEKARALERHTLRHKNTGKWAKSKLVRAKYDKEVRQELAEQLSVSRGLTKKTQEVDSSEDDDDDQGENICDITLAQDPMNPWMLKRSDKSNVDAEFNFGYKKYLKDKMYKRNEESDSGDETECDKNGLDDNLKILKENLRKVRDMEVTDLSAELVDEERTIQIEDNQIRKLEQNKKVSEKQNSFKSKLQNKKKIISTSDWVVDEVIPSNTKDAITSEDITTVFENFEDKVASRVARKLRRLKREINNLERKSKKSDTKSIIEKVSKETDNLEYLKMKNRKQRPIIDEELIETNKGVDDTNQQTSPLQEALKATEPTISENVNTDIDPNRFIEVKPKYLNTVISKSGSNNFDDLDDEEQVVPKVDIEEVFEEDDVVTSFRQEKEDEINENIPKEINLTLPGWGDWGGKGVKAPKRKRNRFIAIKPPKMLRRDENKGDIIINEFKNPKLAAHKVSDLPFPFSSVKEYEECIRTPLGNTFIPEMAHKKLIRPSVITKSGTIIEPMDEEELLVARNRNFKNESVIKILGKQ